MTITFSVNSIRGGCDHGTARAMEAATDPAREYTIAEMIAEGVRFGDLLWLMTRRAAADGATVPLFQAWARACVKEQGITWRRFRTVEDCTNAIMTAARKVVTGKATGKAAKIWALSVLQRVLKEGDF